MTPAPFSNARIWRALRSSVPIFSQGCFMHKFLTCFMCLLLFTACESNKKATERKAAESEKAQQEYDYRTALQNYKIGINHIHHDELPEAIAALEKAVKVDSTNFRYHHGLGLAYSLNGQLDDALLQLEESMRINPSFSEGLNLMGTIYTDQEKYDEAVICFHKVIRDRSFSQPKFGYFNLGKVKRLQNRTDEAIAAYNLAIQSDPEFYRAYVALAEIYKEQKDYAKVLYYYQKAEPNYSTDVNVLFNIGHALFRLKRYDRAKSYLAQVSILSPPPSIDKPTQDMLNAINQILREQRY